ncbi:tRNA epoxyqueuosine(34) reductase QueG [Methylovorus sp. MM2]|uniref:tRNA epoxyqueuosine(34) reductase QueG n=1 Tax=Methylovorus sp. MM2 TaxID=1848038 RepID=UPI0007E08B85|nr:tRNA epoxyqueuosine(34) reductase QueG [Methylovorus sp. MM2]OAM53373.1 tRNA epoxyqueuosine(34) reductase QueG [Methylovorus sp. MM2]
MQNTFSDLSKLAADIKQWGLELGFSQLGITDTNLSAAEPEYKEWLVKGFHGAMDYMAKHGDKRTRPAELVPGTVRVISVRMDYRPPNARNSDEVMLNGTQAFISRYALGRDYHKVMRNRLQKLCERISQEIGPFGFRVFTDSAPVMEVALAERSGLGWRGKHTLLLSRDAGSWFFLGEVYIDIPLPIDAPTSKHCGTCTACIDVCPTQAIVAPYEVDARRCISYLTIELKESIPEPLRPLIGNRVYGCDDCQLTCPWNKFAQITKEEDFHVRHGLDDVTLVELFAWDESTFKQKMTGSAIYRIGYSQWLRNIAVGLGNAPSSPEIISALESRQNDESALVKEHVEWALNRHKSAIPSAPYTAQ